MAFDGITVAAVAAELKQKLVGGRIYKIAQPETDELILTIKNASSQYRLLISADASLPLVYLTGKQKQAPLTAPNFCMLLRKHLQNARIVEIVQPGLERVLEIRLEHLNELGDLCTKKLMVETMGKHSNIIFVDEENRIIDSIKRVSGMVSSVREVLPGRNYFIPGQEKADPLTAVKDSLVGSILCKPMPAAKAIYSSYTGISAVIAQEICFRAGVDGDLSTDVLSGQQKERLAECFLELMEEIRKERFLPQIIYEGKEPKEYAAIPLKLYGDCEHIEFESISELLDIYYAQKSELTRIRQKSADLRKIVQTALERSAKKYDLQTKQKQDTEKREQYRIYGELLNTYGYGVSPGASSFEAVNYYNGETVTIPLDPLYSAAENAKRYFERYGKLKRTDEAMEGQLAETKREIEHLESVAISLDIARREEDLLQIREELVQSGYIRQKGTEKKTRVNAKPLHFVSSDGYHMYVGKNNYQNEELTFKLAEGGDWWFHAKGIPGSHVIVKAGAEMPPDRTFEEAARLAAHFSKGAAQDKVEVDYIQKKHVKRASGGKPGFVIYHTNFSMLIGTDIEGIRQADS